MNQIDLKDRVAVVTGGTGDIGRAIVDRLLNSGAKVAVWDLRVPEKSELRYGLVYLQADVTDEAAVTAVAAETIECFGKIDILVNCAGITGPTKPLEDYDYATWKRTVDVNLSSVFLCCRAVIPTMKTNAYGRIVNIASVAGKDPNPQMVAYSSAKAAVIALTKGVGRELVETGILINCVTPGLIATELLKQMSDESVALSRSKVPLNRIGQPEEVGNLVAWLCSAECSFTTGAAFDISGGRATY
jgi:NAD(P)-dependent dehydrogenase (short-subunit alcohol dehydrogenase family)